MLNNMKRTILLILFVSLPTFSEEIVVEGIREKLKGMEPVCDGKPAPEIDRDPSPKIKSKSFSKEESDKILTLYNENTKNGNTCLSKFVSSYQSKLYDYCTKYNVAACIAGGCEHTVGYSINASVLEKALSKCKIKH